MASGASRLSLEAIFSARVVGGMASSVRSASSVARPERVSEQTARYR